MKKIIVMFVVAMMATTSALAQFPDNVKEVLKKCDEKMTSYNTDAGVVFDILTITKITKGCSDNWFKLDNNRYKNAIVVRR